MAEEVYSGSPIAVLADALEGGLKAGSAGAIVSAPGVGKTALAVHLELDELLRGGSALHVAVGDSVERARAYYDAVFEAIIRRARGRDWTEARVRAERHRMILSYKSLDVAHLRQSIEMLGAAADFQPTVLLVDGLDGGDFFAQIGELSEVAAGLGIPVWCTVTSEASISSAQLFEHCAVGLRLEPDGNTVHLSEAHTPGERHQLAVDLDPRTMLVVGFDRQATDAADGASIPAEVTLFSGGARGSEETFGMAAERWGVGEVHFTFKGHRQSRTQGSTPLSDQELAAGDVSLVYVSKRLNRTYNTESSLIRRVLQTLWHMVSRSKQVFVVGAIQEDGTVTGGTGWSVELARMWNKELWVYDQDRLGWYQWMGETWETGEPIIHSVHIAGTGTRYLTDEGRQAIVELFQRSFGAPLY